MKYAHMVKVGGKYYKPGDEPEDSGTELAELKAEADKRGISYNPRIGIDKLRAKIEESDRKNGGE